VLRASFIASVIFLVFFTEPMRSRRSFRAAVVCGAASERGALSKNLRDKRRRAATARRPGAGRTQRRASSESGEKQRETQLAAPALPAWQQPFLRPAADTRLERLGGGRHAARGRSQGLQLRRAGAEADAREGG
jgi:hypothetical protein